MKLHQMQEFRLDQQNMSKLDWFGWLSYTFQKLKCKFNNPKLFNIFFKLRQSLETIENNYRALYAKMSMVKKKKRKKKLKLKKK